MRIPSESNLRESFYWEVIQNCLVSRETRRANYDRLRSYALFGAPPDRDYAVYNKVDSHLDQLTSFLFAADTTRFSILLGASADKKRMMPMISPLVARLNDKWQDSNADHIFGLAVYWSLVYDSMFVKLIQRGTETMPFLVDPGNIGVLREDVPMLDRQEAFVQVFQTTRSQLERDLDGHPNKNLILMRLSASRKQDGDLPAGVQRVIVGATYPLQGTLTGNAPPPLVNVDGYRPKTAEELVEGYELWIWDDSIEGSVHGRKGGYRCVTLLDPSICIYDRAAYDRGSRDGKQLFLEGEHPFIQVCPNPLPDYFWGASEVQKLVLLQDRREMHMAQASNMVDRAVDPPKAISGMWGAVDEKNLAMQKINALISSTDPVAKIQEFKPTVPSDLWQLVDRDDQMFDEASALTNISKGRGEAGVRSKGQTDTLLRVSSSRPKKRALIIEDSLERVATLYLQLDQVHDATPLRADERGNKEGEEFISRQFTGDYMVKVDAHSSSPIFMEEQRSIAYELFDRGIIDGEAVIDAVAPQNAQLLKQQYREMQKMKAAAAAAQQAQEALQQGSGQGKVTPLRQQG